MKCSRAVLLLPYAVFRALLFSCLLIIVSCAAPRFERTGIPESGGEGYTVASWYGPDFHGRPTASGEIFDMHELTCAHRELPFGTKVRVTSLSTNLSTVCTVNDRGPFVGGRGIDLSYASAKEIGLIGPGTGRVLLETQGRDASYIRPVKVSVSGGNGPFAIQVGSFTDAINAIRLKKGLGLKFDNVYIQEAEVRGGIFYRVRIGNFGQFEKAFSLAEDLGREGYPAIVLRADVRI